MVKFGKKFFFDNSYVKKDKTITIVIIVTVLLLILTTLFITSKFIEKNDLGPQKKVELYDKVSINIFDFLPDKLTYFSHLENININDIKVTYQDNLPKENDYTNCSESQKEIIENIKKGNEYDGDIEEAISCLNYKITKAGNYSVKITIGKEEYSTNLEVVDSEPPILTVKDFEIFTDEKYTENDFVESCTDNSNEQCNIEFLNTSIVDYSKYKEPGEYKIKLKAIDSSGNESETQIATLIIKEIIYHTVTFDTDGGSSIESQSIRDGYTASYPKTTSKNNYTFEGWYTGTKEFDFSTPITSDITIKAKWKKVNTSSGSGNSGGSNTSGGGGNSGGGTSSKCVKYNESSEDVSIYLYQIIGGSASDCMPTATSKYASQAKQITATYKDKILNEIKSENPSGYRQCNINTTTKTNQVDDGSKIVGYKLSVVVSMTCPSSANVYPVNETFDLYCTSPTSCTY